MVFFIVRLKINLQKVKYVFKTNVVVTVPRCNIIIINMYPFMLRNKCICRSAKKAPAQINNTTTTVCDLFPGRLP